MAVKIEWRPVLQPLMLKEYHADYGEEKIMVCVNPQPAFMKERADLMSENTRRLVEVNLLKQKADLAKVGDGIALARQAYSDAMSAYLAWGETVFLPAINDWFARLLSLGGEPYTAADIAQYQEIDPHFDNWLKMRSIEMIDAHASARKKV